MNVNKEINKHHKALDKVLDEMIINDLERVGDMYFKKYQPMIDEVNAIVEECYSYNVMSEELYDEIINRYAEICIQTNGEQRKAEIDNMVQRACDDNIEKYYDAICNILFKPVVEIARLGFINRDRCLLEKDRAEFRLNKKRQRFTDMYVNEIEHEFISVIFFARDALLDYSRAGRVIWNDEEEIEVEVTLDEVYGVVKTDNIKFIIDMAIDNGYTKVRQTGSHTIWKHKNGNIVVIPVHSTIDVYLGMAIQKQIIERKEM